MDFKLPKNVQFILDRFNSAGYEAFVVGGPVRDILRGVVPHDYDITTSARPEEIKALFSDIRTVDTGIQHGTVTLVIDGSPYEVTTYRIDGEYLDSRHPVGVEFCNNLSLDLMRRDFTMNAIAYNPRVGIVDTTGGKDDIDARLIRCVGDAHVRFSEDALRILRALRFSATLGFGIERKTRGAIFELAESALLVSRERIFAELKKLISGKWAKDVLSEYISVISLFVPEWRMLGAPLTIDFQDADFTVRLVSLFAGAGASAKDFADRMRALRADGLTVRRGEAVLSSLGKYQLGTRRGLISLLLELGKRDAELLCRVAVAVGAADSSCISELSEIISSTPLTLSEIKASGEDISSLGFSGKRIGEVLSALLRAVAYGEVENDRDSLTELAKSMKK